MLVIAQGPGRLPSSSLPLPLLECPTSCSPSTTPLAPRPAGGRRTCARGLSELVAGFTSGERDKAVVPSNGSFQGNSVGAEEHQRVKGGAHGVGTRTTRTKRGAHDQSRRRRILLG